MKEALKLALEALENHCGNYKLDDAGCKRWNKAVAAINEALAQPEQEPMAWTVVGDGKFGEIEIGQHAEIDLDACRYWVSRGYSLVPLYTAPPKRPWIGLTDDEIDVIDEIDEATWNEDHKSWGIHDFARAIEAALKEKNT